MGVIVISVFLDNVKEEEEVDTKKSFCFVFFATLRQLRDYRLVLLIPMTIYIGLEISFLSGDFTSVSFSPRKSDQALTRCTWNRIEVFFPHLVSYKWTKLSPVLSEPKVCSLSKITLWSFWSRRLLWGFSLLFVHNRPSKALRKWLQLVRTLICYLKQVALIMSTQCLISS